MLIELKPENGKNQPKVMSFNFSVEFLHCLIAMKINNKTNRFLIPTFDPVHLVLSPKMGPVVNICGVFSSCSFLVSQRYFYNKLSIGLLEMFAIWE